ncbi:MAG: hypothetical protein K5765_07010 [Clostridia bacterium]|nr:hypothetical protein [Clostridia bacterium]
MRKEKWIVWLHKDNQEISYGDLTDIIHVKQTVVVNGIRVKKSKEEIENEKRSFRERIVMELNNLLPNACLRQKTMYYHIRKEK